MSSPPAKKSKKDEYFNRTAENAEFVKSFDHTVDEEVG